MVSVGGNKTMLQVLPSSKEPLVTSQRFFFSQTPWFHTNFLKSEASNRSEEWAFRELIVILVIVILIDKVKFAWQRVKYLNP